MEISHLSTVAQPSGWVQRFASLIPRGQVLDLACGTGRNASYLAGLGYAVLALDRNASSFAALQQQGIDTIEHDLEATDSAHSWPFATRSLAGIVVCNYLYRPLFPQLLTSLEEGGILIYETFAQGNAQFGKPSNPEFLLNANELLEQMRSVPDIYMQIIAFEDGYVDQPKPAMVQRVCARRALAASAADRLALAVNIPSEV